MGVKQRDDISEDERKRVKKKSRKDISEKSNSSSKRRESISSEDSRTAAMELDVEAENELLSVVDDVRAFMRRNAATGLPDYISRQQIVQELARVVSTPSIDNDTKVEAIDISWQLISQSKNVKESSACLEISLPTVVSQLGSRHTDRRLSAVRFLRQSLACEEHRRQVIGHLARNGINRKRDRVAFETMAALPGLFLPDVAQMKIGPVLVALYDELEKKEREKPAFAALIRHRDMLGKAFFDECSDTASKTGRSKFEDMLVSLGGEEDVEDHSSDYSFGLFPNATVNMAMDKTTCEEGTKQLRRELERNRDDFSLLLPYLNNFVKFLGSLMYDQPKVVLTGFECYELLLKSSPSALEKKHSQLLTLNLIKLGPDAAKMPQVKAELHHVMIDVMGACGPVTVVDILLGELDRNSNPRMREDLLIYTILALFTYPGSYFDLEPLVRKVMPCLMDPKRRVRQATLECLAMLDAALGSERSSGVMLDAVEEISANVTDDRETMNKVVKARLTRKVLPKVTEEGFVEYGLIVNSRSSLITGGGGGRGKKTSVDVTGGADVEWILKGSGGLSKGSVVSSNSSSTVAGSSQSLGSLHSVRSSYSVNNERRDSSFSRRARVPNIRKSRSESPVRGSSRRRELKQNQSWADVANAEEEDILKSTMEVDDEEKMEALKKKYETRKVVKDELHPIDDEEIKTRWKKDKRDLSPAELRERRKSYGTITKFESTVDLRAAAATPPATKALPSLKEEDEQKFRKQSLRNLGLGETTQQFKTLFDEEEGVDDRDAPGAFKEPEQAYQMAKHDLRSDQWQTEIDGLDAIVRLVKYHPNIITDDIKYVVGAVLAECRNLRSQVTRAAMQTLIQMFLHLGRSMEIKSLDEVTQFMLTKSADTNKFLRDDANKALKALSENVSIFKAVTVLSRAGLEHKNGVARMSLAKLLSNMVEKLGAERVMNEREQNTLAVLLNCGVVLLADGSADTRTEIRRMFLVIVDHPDFDASLEELVESKKDLETARRALQSVKDEKTAHKTK